MGSSPITSRERVIKALRFDRPDRAPRDLWTLPGVPKYRKAALDRLLSRYPVDFTVPDFRYGPAERAKGVAAENLKPVGKGATNFLTTNATKEGRQMNRRVEFTIFWR